MPATFSDKRFESVMSKVATLVPCPKAGTPLFRAWQNSKSAASSAGDMVPIMSPSEFVSAVAPTVSSWRFLDESHPNPSTERHVLNWDKLDLQILAICIGQDLDVLMRMCDLGVLGESGALEKCAAPNVLTGHGLNRAFRLVDVDVDKKTTMHVWGKQAEACLRDQARMYPEQAILDNSNPISKKGYDRARAEQLRAADWLQEQRDKNMPIPKEVVRVVRATQPFSRLTDSSPVHSQFVLPMSDPFPEPQEDAADVGAVAFGIERPAWALSATTRTPGRQVDSTNNCTLYNRKDEPDRYIPFLGSAYVVCQSAFFRTKCRVNATFKKLCPSAEDSTQRQAPPFAFPSNFVANLKSRFTKDAQTVFVAGWSVNPNLVSKKFSEVLIPICMLLTDKLELAQTRTDDAPVAFDVTAKRPRLLTVANLAPYRNPQPDATVLRALQEQCVSFFMTEEEAQELAQAQQDVMADLAAKNIAKRAPRKPAVAREKVKMRARKNDKNRQSSRLIEKEQNEQNQASIL